MKSAQISMILAKEIGILLRDIRKKARLTQSEVAERLGLSSKSGTVSISHLEKGKFKNLSLDFILGYLTICEKPWSSFFEKLAGIYFNKKHDKIMGQVPTTKYYKKIGRDVAKYTHSIKTKFSEKQNIKPLTKQKKEKMSVGFAQHRVMIEPIEAGVQKLLGELSAPLYSNQFYKAFARECYSALKKYYHKDPLLLTQRLAEIMKTWKVQGLTEEILEKVKEITIRAFTQQK